ncbi:hypothetical protein T11_8337 [Trichinella zimbabwensis]|uniref:Uncharacterized protein n=1 Tax=Trichinella zimbabwensis TaxID=268475 RepID=A0A0V1GEQ3_9BILA|nr:hypothetical protein T11_8337 [Trichinella zimbabwensis]
MIYEALFILHHSLKIASRILLVFQLAKYCD